MSFHFVDMSLILSICKYYCRDLVDTAVDSKVIASTLILALWIIRGRGCLFHILYAADANISCNFTLFRRWKFLWVLNINMYSLFYLSGCFCLSADCLITCPMTNIKHYQMPSGGNYTVVLNWIFQFRPSSMFYG